MLMLLLLLLLLMMMMSRVVFHLSFVAIFDLISVVVAVVV